MKGMKEGMKEEVKQIIEGRKGRTNEREKRSYREERDGENENIRGEWNLGGRNL